MRRPPNVSIASFSFLIASAGMLLGAASLPSCNEERDGGGDMSAPDPTDGMVVPLGALYIMPSNVTLDLAATGPAVTQAFQVFMHQASGDVDVTSASTFTLMDPTLGTMSGGLFTAGTAHGGTSALIAVDGAMSATAMIHLRVHGTFNGPDCPGCTFPGDTAPACAATTPAINVVYPPDGVLLPPNMEVISVQWKPFGAAIKQFEVDFKNSVTDVRVNSKCATQTVDTEQTPIPSGGCELALDTTMWDFIAKSNRGGDPVVVTVRGTTDGVCATPSVNMTNISFGQEDVNGGVFYWKSTVSGNGVGGQIWAKAFGDATPEEQITSSLTGSCNGCHALSRDGTRMVVNADDDDSDDEYSDVRSLLLDVKLKTTIGSNTYQPAGFQTFNPDHTLYLGSNGSASGATNSFFMWNGNTGLAATPANVGNVGVAGDRPTQPDWSADGKSVVFAKPMKVGSSWRSDDDHIFGGSLYTMPYITSGLFGPPVPLVTSAGENNYYPSYSPDGQFVVFNRVPLTGTVATIDACTGSGQQRSCANDSFSNPAARVVLLPTTSGAMPIDCAAANGSPAASPTPVSNSWPRWSPFIQTYKGNRLLWVTFSSTRDYGLRVRNHQPGMFQCYPADSFEQPGSAHSSTFAPNCQQPQIWMAAINLTAAETIGTAVDPSYPAFWLPFQDITTHNHTAQWTETVATQPPVDMGTCIMKAGSCAAAPTNCCSGLYCGPDGTCTDQIL